MAGNVRTPESCMRVFLQAEFVNAKPYTRQKCEWSLLRTKRALEAAGYSASPRTIGAEEVGYLLDVVWKDNEVSYRKEEFFYLQRYLLFFNNDVTKRMKVVFPPDMRVNADWLDDAQYDALVAVPKTPLQDIVIHLELCMGLRNVEVCRVMLSDIHSSRNSPYINVRGKGRGNGKYRSVRFHYETQAVLDRWMRERGAIVATVRAYNPGWEDPGTLILWCHYKNRPDAGAYGEHTGALDDRVLDPLRKELGFHFANHTLRRTFGRRLFHAGVSVEVISKFLGHESTSETLKYIGVNLDDMDEGMARLAQYDRRFRPERERDGPSQRTWYPANQGVGTIFFQHIRHRAGMPFLRKSEGYHLDGPRPRPLLGPSGGPLGAGAGSSTLTGCTGPSPGDDRSFRRLPEGSVPRLRRKWHRAEHWSKERRARLPRHWAGASMNRATFKAPKSRAPA